MGATTMEKITSLLTHLSGIAADYTQLQALSFAESDSFAWDATTSTIYFNPHDAHADQYTLHEFSHAFLGHSDYRRDISLIRMERDAWRKASELSKRLHITIDASLVEDSLDTYRDWLHNRSLCPSCATTGIQTDTSSYRCIACGQQWRANEARTCALRRYTTKKRPI